MNAARVIVIDDNEAIHDDFRKILATEADFECDELAALEAELLGLTPEPEGAQGFAVDSAISGEAGLKLVEASAQTDRPYNVAFVDVRMPGGWDGIETAQRLWAADPSLQIVICTAYSDYTWQDMTGRLGAPGRWLILKKPFEIMEVRQMAHSLVEKWTFRREVESRRALSGGR